jgi:hypothetical protein
METQDQRWIGTRALNCIKDGRAFRIEASVGEPVEVTRGEWRCAYRIADAGRESVQYAHGVDSIQALILALEGIRVGIAAIGGEFSWEGGEPGDPGFPRFVPQFYGPAFARKLEAIIDSEVRTFAEEARKLANGVTEPPQ